MKMTTSTGTHMYKRFKMASLTGLAIMASAVLAACGGAAAEATATPTTSSAPAGTTVDLELPDLTITAYQGADVLGGEVVTLSSLVGQGKPVVLNFWAALCPPCRAEMPDIQAVFDGRGHEVTVVGIDIGPQQFLGSREDGKQLLIDLGVTYPAGTTFDEGVVRNFRVVGMPTTFFINADGSLLRAWSGLLNEDKFNEFIDEMLAI
jgi:thiol-disulfide isomerase/thioredoxin